MRRTPYAIAAALLAAALLTSACTESTGLGGDHRVEGTIIFDAGAPSEGPTVLTGRLPMRGAVVRLDRGGIALSATSDGDGRFAFDGLTDGRWRLDVTPPPGFAVAAGQPSPWFVDLTGGGEAPPLEVLLATATDVGTIAAQVTLDGLPLGSYPVSVHAPGGAEPLVTGLTQDSGVATFPISPGTYDVEIRIPNGLPAAGDPVRAIGVTVVAGETTWVLGFAIVTDEPHDPPAAVVFGNAVLDEGVAYVPGVGVTLSRGGTVHSRTTDAFGGFHVGELEPGDWQVTATPPAGYIPADGASLSSTLSLALGDSVYLRIELASADGSGSVLAQALAAQPDSALPVEGATIRALDPSTGDEVASGVTGSNPTHYRSVRLSLAPGVYDVEVVPPAGYLVAPGTPARLEDVNIRTGRLAFVTFEIAKQP